MKILVSTDTSCLVNYETLGKYGISVFPLNVIIDGEEFLDGVTIKQTELAAAMRGNKDVKTSTPPLGQVQEYFENLFAEGYDHIIHFTISSKLSSMYELFDNVAKQNFAGKLTIIDSYALSTVMFSHVMYAYDEVQKGTPVEEIVKAIEERKDPKRNHIVFVPENLQALKKGGRISPAVATIGTILGIKPVILLQNGQLEKSEVVRNVKRTMAERLAKLIVDYPVDKYDYTLITFDVSEQTILYMQEMAKNTLKETPFTFAPLPINVCAHCGPGTVGIVVSEKVNGKNLVDLL